MHLKSNLVVLSMCYRVFRLSNCGSKRIACTAEDVVNEGLYK